MSLIQCMRGLFIYESYMSLIQNVCREVRRARASDQPSPDRPCCGLSLVSVRGGLPLHPGPTFGAAGASPFSSFLPFLSPFFPFSVLSFALNVQESTRCTSQCIHAIDRFMCNCTGHRSHTCTRRVVQQASMQACMAESERVATLHESELSRRNMPCPVSMCASHTLSAWCSTRMHHAGSGTCSKSNVGNGWPLTRSTSTSSPPV